MSAMTPPDALVTGDAVRRAAAAVVDTFVPHAAADWTTKAGSLDWSCGATLGHVADCVLWYALNLAGRTTTADEWDWSEAPPDKVSAVLSIIVPSAELLAVAVDAAAPDARGWHPYGIADASGFAAMACDEMLVHGGDIASGLGVDFHPPHDVCDVVVRRLFPWGPTNGDAWQRLQWANGRVDLAGARHVPPTWLWHCAPLAEWDGVTIPEMRISG
jgi:hypothetical protein